MIELPSESTRFRTTTVRPFHRIESVEDSDQPEDENNPPNSNENSNEDSNENSNEDSNENQSDIPPASTIVPPVPAPRGRGRPRKYPLIQTNVVDTPDPDLCFIMNAPIKNSSQYAASRQKEITGLLKKGVFEVANQKDIPPNTRIFNSRFVDEIKHPGTDNAFEKSRLVIQTYNDEEKALVLTQSSTIQRVSQRLIICLAAVLQDTDTKLYLRDITQAYVQSSSELNRDFYIRSSEELIKMLDVDQSCILKIVKPLYGVSEAENH